MLTLLNRGKILRLDQIYATLTRGFHGIKACFIGFSDPYRLPGMGELAYIDGWDACWKPQMNSRLSKTHALSVCHMPPNDFARLKN